MCDFCACDWPLLETKSAEIPILRNLFAKDGMRLQVQIPNEVLVENCGFQAETRPGDVGNDHRLSEVNTFKIEDRQLESIGDLRNPEARGELNCQRNRDDAMNGAGEVLQEE